MTRQSVLSSECQLQSRLQKRLRRSIRGGAFVLAFLCAGATHAFQLVTLEEQRTNLLDYVGDGERWTVIMFWATDCIPCEAQKPAFEAFHQQYKDSLATAVGVAIDGVENKELIYELIDHHEPSYPNLMAYSDVYQRQFEELVGKSFKITPRYLVFTPSGELHANYYGGIDLQGLVREMSAAN